MSEAESGGGRLTERRVGSGESGELLRRHREGDREAFAALVADYRRPVYAYLVRCGIAEAERDDVFQTVFMKIHRSAEQYRAGEPAHPWIFTIVANEVRSHLRRRRVRGLLFGPPAAHDPPDPAPGSERAVEARETAEWLEAEIRRLPLAQREVLILAAVEGLPLLEVSRALGRPVNTVKTHLRRARLALSRKLAERHTARPAEEVS